MASAIDWRVSTTAAAPSEIDELVAAIERGLTMPLPERRERWRSMFEYLQRHDITAWRRDFLAALDRSRASPPNASAARLRDGADTQRDAAPRDALS